MKSKMPRGKLISQTYNARGEAWRRAFHLSRDGGADRYEAAVVAEAAHGPDEFQRGVCALALERGNLEPYRPPPRGRHK
jgi:hypothetical protein